MAGMIPWRKPPFGVSRIIMSLFKGTHGVDIERVEALYAQSYGVSHAVLLPSCRAGICWALKAACKTGTKVVCTAYTCTVVREAIIRSGNIIDLVDIEENSFLMNRQSLAEKQVGDYAIVLCEIDGYTYDLSEVARLAAREPAIRIVDMAMTVPGREHFERLKDNDVAVISFGAGKCMYAGWGGMVFTRNIELANKVRQIRDASLARCHVTLFIKRSLRMIALNLMYKNVSYGVLKRIKDAKRLRGQRIRSQPDSAPQYPSQNSPISEEWFLPTTYLDRRLMVHNLKNAEEYSKRRLLLAQRYNNNLKGVNSIICPQVSAYPMNYYTIRVKTDLRSLIYQCLCKDGIDAGMLFDFSRSISKEMFPCAYKVSCEVLNMPLNVDLNLSDIDRISESVIRACKKYN
jgi:dTDP-4-amino-4,6-dideoxygalactose transaminase